MKTTSYRKHTLRELIVASPLFFFILSGVLSSCNISTQNGALLNIFNNSTNTPTPTLYTCLILSNYKHNVVTVHPNEESNTYIKQQPTLTNSPTQTKTPHSTPSPTASNDYDKFSICSPLHDIKINELSYIISVPYTPPPPKSDKKHHGVDFAYYHYGNQTTIMGEKVQSILPGKVAAALTNTFPYGNFVIIETPYELLPAELVSKFDINQDQSIYALYAHLNGEPYVKFEEKVEECQIIGEVGKSGNTEAPHLHFETRIGPSNHIFTSMACFVPEANAVDRANYRLWRTSGYFNHFDPMDLLLFSIPTTVPR